MRTTIICAAIVTVVFAALIIFTVRRHKAILENGIETDAVVSRIEEDAGSDDGSVSYSYYVTYHLQDGDPVEARVGNAPDTARVGDRIRVKYIPNKPKYVLMVK